MKNRVITKLPDPRTTVKFQKTGQRIEKELLWWWCDPSCWSSWWPARTGGWWPQPAGHSRPVRAAAWHTHTVFWIQIHWVRIRILNFGPIWIWIQDYVFNFETKILKYFLRKTIIFKKDNFKKIMELEEIF